MLHVDGGERRPAARPSSPIISFSNSYARLPERFFARVDPTPVAAPHLIQFNYSLADQFGLQTASLGPNELAAIFAGNVTPLGAEPIAMAYAGHQFAYFVRQLGDGRAILLGEVLDRDGVRRDIQLKGSGQTPFSRRGDGRAALGPVLREYLVSEAMHALGGPDHAGACGCLDWPTRAPRGPAARGDTDPHRRKPSEGGNLRVFRRARRRRCDQTPRGLYDRSPRRSRQRGCAPLSGSASGGCGSPGAAG